MIIFSNKASEKMVYNIEENPLFNQTEKDEIKYIMENKIRGIRAFDSCHMGGQNISYFSRSIW